MFRPHPADAAVLILLFAVAPAFSALGVEASRRTAPATQQAALSVPERQTIDGYIDRVNRAFMPFGGPNSEIDLCIRSTFGWLVGKSSLSFLNEADYQTAIRYDGQAVVVTGYQVCRGSSRWFVVESLQLVEPRGE